MLDKITDAMKTTIDETNRRRTKQAAYNEAHGIQPLSIVKQVYDLTARLTADHAVAEESAEYNVGRKARALPKDELERLIGELENQMKQAARDLEFERAAVLRDQVYEMRALLVEQSNLPPWKKAMMLSGELKS